MKWNYSLVASLVLVALVLPGRVLASGPDADPVPLDRFAAAPFWSPGAGQPAAAEGRDSAQSAVTLPTTPMPYVSVTPCRLIDTRFGTPTMPVG